MPEVSNRPTHSQAVTDKLVAIKEQTDEVVRVSLAISKAGDGALFPIDLLTFGAIKRHMSTASAFSQLIESRNMLAARSLLRLQIDTALRFSAAWLVADPDEFAREVIHGEQINHLSDRDGQRLTDKRLVTVRSKDLPWLPAVYSNLSGYIHLSASHIVSPVLDFKDHEAQLVIGDTDEHYPESSWLEIANCFLETTTFFLHYLEGWHATKERPRTVPEQGTAERSSEPPSEDI